MRCYIYVKYANYENITSHIFVDYKTQTQSTGCLNLKNESEFLCFLNSTSHLIFESKFSHHFSFHLLSISFNQIYGNLGLNHLTC